MNTKKEFNKLHDKTADGVKIYSKCNWYQHGEKPTSFFLNLEKKRAIGGTIKLLNRDTEITNAADINSSLRNFFENFATKII